MFTALIIFLGIAALFCLYFATACLFVASRENDLPDIEDIEIADIAHR